MFFLSFFVIVMIHTIRWKGVVLRYTECMYARDLFIQYHPVYAYVYMYHTDKVHVSTVCKILLSKFIVRVPICIRVVTSPVWKGV